MKNFFGVAIQLCILRVIVLYIQAAVDTGFYTNQIHD